MIPPVDDRTENKRDLQEAYQTLLELGEKYGEKVTEAAELIEDTLTEEPEQSVTMSYQQAYHRLTDARKDLEMDSEDRIAVSSIITTLEEESDSFPAMGEGRHYSLSERRKNL